MVGLGKDILLEEKNIKTVLERLDQFNTGFLEKSAIENIFCSRLVSRETQGSNIWDKYLAKLDSDNDGKLTFEEFYQAVLGKTEHESLQSE